MRFIIPNKLKHGDTIRVICPSSSAKTLTNEGKHIAKEKFDKLGIKVTFGEHINENDDLGSSPIESRIDDFHQSFLDQNVKAILALRGGYNSNQLLKYINWEIIKKNPKIFCGYSDITSLSNAIYSKTGIITYSGPNYLDFTQKLYFDYTLTFFIKCLLGKESYIIKSSTKWSEDKWHRDQINRNLVENKGYVTLNYGEGKAQGTILGGNLSTLNLLQGTEYFPDIADSILFIEDDSLSTPFMFDRDLQSLIHQPNFNRVQGLIIGRFQKNSNIDINLLRKIIATKKELEKVIILANADFGHTDPKFTFPIGGTGKVNFVKDKPVIKIIKH